MCEKDSVFDFRKISVVYPERIGEKSDHHGDMP
jgi:hypothetical protein